MCERCRWPEWAVEIERLLAIQVLPHAKNFLQGSVNYIRSNQHVPKSLGAALSRISTPYYDKINKAANK